MSRHGQRITWMVMGGLVLLIGLADVVLIQLDLPSISKTLHDAAFAQPIVAATVGLVTGILIGHFWPLSSARRCPECGHEWR